MPFRSEAQRRWMFANHPAMARRWADHTPANAKLPEHVKSGAKIQGTGSIIGDIAELIAEVISRAGTDPAEVKKLLAKEFTGRQLVEDVGNFGSLVKQKGFGGAVTHGAKITADTLTRQSGKYPAQSLLGWGYTLPYTAHAVNESLNDPNAGPGERYLRAGAEAVLNPLTINPHMGFTTAMALNYGGPQLAGGAGRMIDQALGTAPRQKQASLFYYLVKEAVLRTTRR